MKARLFVAAVIATVALSANATGTSTDIPGINEDCLSWAQIKVLEKYKIAALRSKGDAETFIALGRDRVLLLAYMTCNMDAKTRAKVVQQLDEERNRVLKQGESE